MSAGLATMRRGRRLLLHFMRLYGSLSAKERSLCRWALVSIGVALAVSGCGLTFPTPPKTTTSVVGAATAHQATTSSSPNEIPTPPGPTENAPGAATPAQALTHFATSYINWDASDVKAQLAKLARQSVGQARSAMQLAAAQVGSDPELQQDGVANSGTVEAVSRVAGGEYVVVTRERTTAADSDAYQGLGASWHLTIATVRRAARGAWIVSGWQPQS